MTIFDAKLKFQLIQQEWPPLLAPHGENAVSGSYTSSIIETIHNYLLCANHFTRCFAYIIDLLFKTTHLVAIILTVKMRKQVVNAAQEVTGLGK